MLNYKVFQVAVWKTLTWGVWLGPLDRLWNLHSMEKLCFLRNSVPCFKWPIYAFLLSSWNFLAHITWWHPLGQAMSMAMAMAEILIMLFFFGEDLDNVVGSILGNKKKSNFFLGYIFAYSFIHKRQLWLELCMNFNESKSLKARELLEYTNSYFQQLHKSIKFQICLFMGFLSPWPYAKGNYLGS